jgi:hypothetical protein
MGLLVVGLPLLVLFENWRGKRAWEKFVQESEAKGDDLSPEAVIPPEVPDEENFAAIPLFADLFEYENFRQGVPNGETIWLNPVAKERLDKFTTELRRFNFKTPGRREGVMLDLAGIVAKSRSTNEVTTMSRRAAAELLLTDLGQFDDILREVRDGTLRKQSRFPIHYEDGYSTLLPHLSAMKLFTQLAALRASAELEVDPSQAHGDLKTGLRLTEIVDNEPLLISQLVRIAQTEIILAPLWEGLVNNRWNDAQMQQMEQQLAGWDFLQSLELAMRGERNLMALRTFDLMVEVPEAFASTDGSDDPGQLEKLRHMPSAFAKQSSVNLGKAYGQLIAAINVREHLVYPDKVARLDAELEQWKKNFLLKPYHIFTSLLLPAVMDSHRKFTYTQSSIDMARLALILERHHLKHGAFPQFLDDLDMELLPGGDLPRQVVNGEPYRYRLTRDGGYELYSVGWNLVDDGGKTQWGDKKKTFIDNRKLDWVWPRPGMEILEFRLAPISGEANE